MKTLANLIDEFGANVFVYADAGNGSAFSEDGETIEYDSDASGRYGGIELAPLPEPTMSADCTECHYASDWIVAGDGTNPYRFKVMF